MAVKVSVHLRITAIKVVKGDLKLQERLAVKVSVQLRISAVKGVKGDLKL